MQWKSSNWVADNYINDCFLKHMLLFLFTSCERTAAVCGQSGQSIARGGRKVQVPRPPENRFIRGHCRSKVGHVEYIQNYKRESVSEWLFKEFTLTAGIFHPFAMIKKTKNVNSTCNSWYDGSSDQSLMVGSLSIFSFLLVHIVTVTEQGPI